MNQVSAPRRMILKPRQIGSTTNEVIKLFDKTIFTRNFTACIMAHEADAIKKIFRIAKRAYASMPDTVRPQIDRGGGSKYEMGFPEINSLIYCDLESRGDTVSHLHVSEAAFVEHERFISTMQAVPLHGHVTIESTANGVGNWFYDLWTDKNDYEKLFFPWFFDPLYRLPGGKLTRTKDENDLARHALKRYKITISDDQLRFRRMKQAEIKDYFLQEYPEDPETCFLLSGGVVVDRRIIGDLLKKAAEPVEKTDTLQIFKPRYSRGQYVIGCDVAQGVGGDWSVASVFDIQTREQVARLRAQLSPFQFAHAIKSLADLFTTGNRLPLVAVESNNHGHAVLMELSEHIGYPRLYCGKKDTLGWITNSVTRPIMINQFIEAVISEGVTIHCKDTLREMLTLVNNNGKIEAAQGRHDDCVMASGIAVSLLINEAAKANMYRDIGRAVYV